MGHHQYADAGSTSDIVPKHHAASPAVFFVVVASQEETLTCLEYFGVSVDSTFSVSHNLGFNILTTTTHRFDLRRINKHISLTVRIAVVIDVHPYQPPAAMVSTIIIDEDVWRKCNEQFTNNSSNNQE
jgi:hypothetical protein